MKMHTCLLNFLLLFLIAKAGAQTTISGEIRPRTEYRSGFQKPLADTLQPALVTLQRTRLNFDYQSKILNASLTFQDARIWGKGDTKGSPSKIEIYEAWAEYLMSSGFSARFGRQSLKYDDQRLIGPSNWSNSGNAHDALLLKYKTSNNLQAHLALMYNNFADTLMEINYPLKKMYKSMGVLWLSKVFTGGYNVSGIAITEGLQKTNEYKIIYPRITYGGNFVYQNDSSIIGGTATAYIQSGKNSSFKNLNAFMMAAKISAKVYKQNSVFVGYEYYSGSKSDIDKSKSKTFEKLYGANHSFNGNLEYWRSVPSAGLQNIYLGVTGKLTSKLSLDVTFHSFALTEIYMVGVTEIDKNMGSEIDLVANYSISKEISLQAGYCTYFTTSGTTDYLKMTGVNFSAPKWAYIMFTIKPTFYKTPATNL